MFENPRRGRQEINFTTNVSKILDLKSSSEQIFFRKLSLGAPDNTVSVSGFFRELKQRTGRRRRQSERQTAKGLDKQNNNFACASRLFVHSFAVVARLRLESALFRVLWRT